MKVTGSAAPSEAAGELSGAQGAHHCLDCPATRNDMLNDLIGASSANCQFESLAVEARETVPLRWFGQFGFGVVRRGALIRQRTDAQGRVTAIDVVGPGCAFPIESRPGEEVPASMAAGYSVIRTLICLCKESPVAGSLRKGGATAVDLHTLHREAVYRMERLADARARQVAASRVAALLCTLADTLVRHESSGQRIPAGFLQRDLAALVSIRHESVCRVMREFSKRGLIEQSNDGIHLLQRDKLEGT